MSENDSEPPADEARSASGKDQADAEPAPGAATDGDKTAQEPGDREASHQGTSDPERPSPEQQGQKERRASVDHGYWEAFALHHEKLKHLTTVGLVLSGGVITLFQSKLMEPNPLEVVGMLAFPVLSSLLTLAAQASLANEASIVKQSNRDEKVARGEFGVPMEIHWIQLVALLLLSSGIGLTAVVFLVNTGLLSPQ